MKTKRGTAGIKRKNNNWKWGTIPWREGKEKHKWQSTMELDRGTLSMQKNVWWWVGSDEGIIYWGEESSSSVHWFRFLTNVPYFKCSATVHVGVCINNCHILPSNVVMVHVQPMRTYKDHCLSVLFCVFWSWVAMIVQFHHSLTGGRLSLSEG